MSKQILNACAGFFLLASLSPCQNPPADPPDRNSTSQDSANAVPHADRHILGIIPNFRTSPTLATYQPITSREKFKIASQDSFDRGAMILAALFAGKDQLSNSNPSFGQGVKGYAQYFGGSYAGFVVGDFMTEGILPTAFHQDPRYFRRGKGSGLSRLAYSMGQIFLTHGDSGHTQFNFSEVVGNSAAVAISQAYYKDNRTAHDAVGALAVQLGTDMATNVLKEFWPDFDRRFRHKHSSDADSARH